MRLHRLAMTAIGPFADRVEIDFGRFGDSGLFLLEGPTGAGKSTVIDAISFALYGKLAQSSAVLERLKSHHSAPATEPVVELVFETQSGLYRIRRTPTFERPKKRGTGTIAANMTVKLWRLSSPDQLDGGELISNSLGDTEDEITRAVGLTHPHFVQTVVLPQGEIASFLRASTNDKRALLQRLFGTELLARTQDELVEGRRVAEQRRAAAVDEVRRAGHAFAGATGLADDQATELASRACAGDHAAVTALVAGVGAELLTAQTVTGEQHAAATAARLDAQQALLDAQELDRRRRLRQNLRTEYERLLATGDEHAAAMAELADAERALTVVSAAESLATAIARSDQAQDAAAAARLRLPDALSRAGQLALRAACDERRTLLGELSEELRRERELVDQRAEYERLQQEASAQGQRRSAAADELAALPVRQAELTAARDQAVAAASRREALSAERDRARHRLVAAEQAVAAARAAAENQQLAQEVFDAEQRQQTRLESLRISWRASIASELGLALRSGQECVVCGSVEHPRPASPARGHVSQEQLNSAEAELRRLTGEVESRRDELARQRAELLELQLRAEQLTPERAAGKLDQAETSLTAALAAADQQQALDRELAALSDRFAELAGRSQQAALAETRLAERSAAVLAGIERDELAVDRARDGYLSVADRVAELTDETARIDAAAAHSAAADTSVAAAAEAGATFSGALAVAGFDTQLEWQRARRGSAQLAQLRDQVRDYQTRLTSVTAKLDTPELTDPALDGQPPDLTWLAETVRAAEQAEHESAKAHGAAADRYAAATRHTELLDRATRQSAQVLADTAPAVRVGNLVAGLGDNRLKMELTTYVLVRRFTEIVSAANTELRRISGGRYELEHTDARTGNSRSGLGLRVLDLHTGRPRDPGTLSGGETFYVSLALALGLADIVRAESGGIDLGTLFIDEGFGGLDPEVLDQVLAVLDGLREGGRVVGVVSHVAELKARIADQIQVRRNADGSSRLRTSC